MYNRVIITGRLCADPELKQTQSGIAFCRIRVAVNRPKNRDTGEQVSDFFTVACWKNTAEFVCRYFSKGKFILVEGQLRNNDYTDNNGVKHYGVEILANAVDFCGDSNQNAQQPQTAGNPVQQTAQSNYNRPADALGTPYIPAQNPASVFGSVPAQPVAMPAANNPAYMQQTAQQPQAQNQGLSIGSLNEFEEILSEGALPF